MRENKVRIKWFKRKDGRIVSEPMELGSEVMRVFIDVEKLYAQFKDLNERWCFSAVRADSIKDIKRLSREKAIRLGARFNDEIRNKKYTEAKKAKKQTASKQKTQNKKGL